MQARATITATAMLLALSGCMSPPPLLDKLNKNTDNAEVSRGANAAVEVPSEANSEIIAALLARRSMLEPGSAYDRVARAALAASAQTSEAELRQAKLRAAAKSKNWLPTIGPNISLNTLGDLVAGLLVEQVLFDGGRRKAEREFAAADVEVAAANLAIDINDRVESAVSLYITAMRGSEKAALSNRALSRMYEFERIVIGRVQGGVSDRADQRVVEARINDLTDAKITAEEATNAATSELMAITGERFDGKPRHLQLAEITTRPKALAVVLAEAEGKRTIAQAKYERAGFMPQITASGNVSTNGSSAGLKAGSQPIGFGTRAAIQAIEAGEDIAQRVINDAHEEARRNYSRQLSRLGSFQRQSAEAARLAQDARVTFDLFQRQFKAGQRTVMEVINVYETLIDREQAHVDAKYEVALIQLEMAADLGLLADGEEI